MKDIIKFILIFLSIGVPSRVYSQPSIAYQGGDGNGYSSEIVTTNNNTLFIGGSEVGVYSNIYIHNNNTLYIGGHEDGIYSSIKSTNNNVLYIGGVDDGYASFYDKKDFIWTGTIGQGWTVAGNWNYNVVPDINRRTIIPAGVPNYPHVNAGLFAIGDNPNNGAYKSGEVIILPGALLVTRVNCKVENYGLIKIEGHMNVKKNTSDAFKNLLGGQVIVKSNGLLSF